MTREEMWEEFESQLKSEVRTPITMSYDESIRIAEMGIKDVVKKWKKRLDQEPKTGHWITKGDKEQGYDICGVKTWYIKTMCSECGFINTAIEGHTAQYNYCPECGAKMAEGEAAE